MKCESEIFGERQMQKNEEKANRKTSFDSFPISVGIVPEKKFESRNLDALNIKKKTLVTSQIIEVQSEGRVYSKVRLPKLPISVGIWPLRWLISISKRLSACN